MSTDTGQQIWNDWTTQSRTVWSDPSTTSLLKPEVDHQQAFVSQTEYGGENVVDINWSEGCSKRPILKARKGGSGAPAMLDLTALYACPWKTGFMLMPELAGSHTRPSNWLTDLQSVLGDWRSHSTVLHQNALRLCQRRSRYLRRWLNQAKLASRASVWESDFQHAARSEWRVRH